MAFVSVSKGGDEYIFEVKPCRMFGDYWDVADPFSGFRIPKGSIKKLIGRELKWSDSPVELKWQEYMNKVEMKRSQIRDKFGFRILCDLFCVFARGKKHRECNFQDETGTLRIVRAHCREAENAFAAYHNVKLID